MASPSHQVSLVHSEREDFPRNYAGVGRVAPGKLLYLYEAADVDRVEARPRSDLVNSLQAQGEHDFAPSVGR